MASRSTPSRIAVLLFLIAPILTVACDRKPKKEEANPAPSSSVISIAIGMDHCSDVPFCQKKCDEGNGGECRRLGVTYQLGQGAPKDEARAVGLFEKACALKSPTGCVSAGQMLEYEHGVPKDLTKAAGFYKTACDLEWVPGCYNYAIMLEGGRGVPKDEWNAAYYYDIACRAGLKQGCLKATELREKAPIVVDAAK
jgi:uncharacterized protein